MQLWPLKKGLLDVIAQSLIMKIQPTQSSSELLIKAAIDFEQMWDFHTNTVPFRYAMYKVGKKNVHWQIYPFIIKIFLSTNNVLSNRYLRVFVLTLFERGIPKHMVQSQTPEWQPETRPAPEIWQHWTWSSIIKAPPDDMWKALVMKLQIVFFLQTLHVSTTPCKKRKNNNSKPSTD